MAKHLFESITRRDWLRASGLALVGSSLSGWLPALAAETKRAKRHCVLLWMNGGPSQLDTWDPKPDHANGGPFQAIDTRADGVRISEHLPKLAGLADRLAVIRSMSTKEGDHGRASYLMRTGYRPGGAVEYPTLGSVVSKELGDESNELPNFVSIAPFQSFNPAAYGPGFLGPRFAPATVGSSEQTRPADDGASYAELRLENLQAPDRVDAKEYSRRLSMWQTLEQQSQTPGINKSSSAHRMVYERAVRLMRSQAASAFQLSKEPDKVREAYGRGRFGQGCLLARRLIEQGVPFIEVTLGGSDGNALGWDTHSNNFATVARLSGELDAGFSSLLRELDERGLLDSTTILWMGEFGRTPNINPQGGRDHFNAAWSCVLAGGGIKGGQSYGRTSNDGLSIVEKPVDAPALLATYCAAAGIDPLQQNIGEMGRPIKIAEGDPIADLLA